MSFFVVLYVSEKDLSALFYKAFSVRLTQDCRRAEIKCLFCVGDRSGKCDGLATLTTTHKFHSTEEGLLVQIEPFFKRWESAKELCN